MPFISSSLIAEARTSSSMLNNTGETRHSSHIPDLKENLSVFLVENDICCGHFINGFYDVELCSHYPYNLKSFNQERMLYFVKCFLCINGEVHMFLVFSFFMGSITWIAFRMFNHPFIPGINPTWSW